MHQARGNIKGTRIYWPTGRTDTTTRAGTTHARGGTYIDPGQDLRDLQERVAPRGHRQAQRIPKDTIPRPGITGNGLQLRPVPPPRQAFQGGPGSLR